VPSAEARGEILRVLLRAVPHALRPAELAEVSLLSQNRFRNACNALYKALYDPCDKDHAGRRQHTNRFALRSQGVSTALSALTWRF
jgi:hypothetical protein